MEKYYHFEKDAAKEIIEVLDGGYILYGTSIDDSTYRTSIVLFKIDNNGSVVWSKKFDYGNSCQAAKIIQLADSSLIAAGNISFDTSGNQDVFLYKLNAQGDSIWFKSYSLNQWDVLNDFMVYSDSSFKLIGTSLPSSVNKSDIFLLKIDLNGDSLAAFFFGDSLNRIGKAIIDVPPNSFILGTKRNLQGDNDILLLKLDSNDNLNWSKTIGGQFDDIGESIALSHSQNLVVTCDSGLSSLGGTIGRVIEFDTSGNRVWTRITSATKISDCTVDIQDNIIVTGYTGFVDHEMLYISSLYSNGNLNWINDTLSGIGTAFGSSIIQSKDSSLEIAGYSMIPFSNQGKMYLVKMQSHPFTLITEANTSGKIVISPNPTSQLLRISISEDEISSILVTNLSGKAVYKLDNLAQSFYSLDLSGLRTGEYFLKIITKRSNFYEKVILVK